MADVDDLLKTLGGRRNGPMPLDDGPAVDIMALRQLADRHLPEAEARRLCRLIVQYPNWAEAFHQVLLAAGQADGVPQSQPAAAQTSPTAQPELDNPRAPSLAPDARTLTPVATETDRERPTSSGGRPPRRTRRWELALTAAACLLLAVGGMLTIRQAMSPSPTQIDVLSSGLRSPSGGDNGQKIAPSPSGIYVLPPAGTFWLQIQSTQPAYVAVLIVADQQVDIYPRSSSPAWQVGGDTFSPIGPFVIDGAAASVFVVVSTRPAGEALHALSWDPLGDPLDVEARQLTARLRQSGIGQASITALRIESPSTR